MLVYKHKLTLKNIPRRAGYFPQYCFYKKNICSVIIATQPAAQPGRLYRCGMTLYERIRRALRQWTARPSAPGETPTRRVYHFDDALVQSLRLLAQVEGRTEGDLAEELLSDALDQREAAESNLRRWKRLTPREQQVAALICLQLTNRQIASALGIAPETARSHADNVLAKFELRRRAELRLALADWDFSAWYRAAQGSGQMD